MKNRPADIPYGGLNAYRIRGAKPLFNEEVLEIFKHYVSERYKIHLMKDVEKKPFPWTKDMILSMYRFTNIRREQDKNSRYLIDLMKTHGNRLTYNMLCNIMVFRLFNKIETYELLGGWIDFENYDEEKIRTLLASAPEGYHYFTNAYMSSGMKAAFNRYMPEEKMSVMNIPNVVYKFGKDLYERLKKTNSPQEFIEVLKFLNGINNFLAYQIFVDCTYLPEFPWSENEFVLSGPGCSRGLNHLFKYRDGLTDEELLFWLRDNCPITPEWCMEHMTDLPEYDRVMNVMSLENCMCELSKYMKVKTNSGRPRCLYKIGGLS
jgi:hypothetical protein